MNPALNIVLVSLISFSRAAS